MNAKLIIVIASEFVGGRNLPELRRTAALGRQLQPQACVYRRRRRSQLNCHHAEPGMRHSSWHQASASFIGNRSSLI